MKHGTPLEVLNAVADKIEKISRRAAKDFLHETLVGSPELERDKDGHPIARRPNKPQGLA
jgi:hypothetical protein